MNELFLRVLNTAITAGWLVLAIIAARLVLKKAPAWVKCALWAIVALRLIWPFEIQSFLSLVPSAQTVPPAELYSPMPQVHTGIPVVNATINPVFSQVFAPEPYNSVNPLQVVTAVAGWVWITGMVAMGIYTAISYLRLRRRVRVRVPVDKDVYLSDGVDTPFILGVFRPKIYLPSDISQEKWDNILAHERAHITRRDHWWKPLGFLLLTIFWFHPLLWIGYILLCRDVERACDEKVIKNLTAEEKKTYSEVLLECSVPRKWISACPLAFGETGVKGRIKAVLHYKKPTLWIIIAALLLGSILAVCFLTERKDSSDEPEIYNAAGMQYQLQYGDSMIDTLTISVLEDGNFTYYESLYSSYIGWGTWYQEGNRLFLIDSARGSKYVFLVEADGIRFVAAESTDDFDWVNLTDDTKIPGQKIERRRSMNLAFVRVTEVQDDSFKAVDAKGNWWIVSYPCEDMDFDLSQCWIAFCGEPVKSEDGYLQITAEDCWLYRENNEGRTTMFDRCAYDLNGDSQLDTCVLSFHVTTTNLFVCKMTVSMSDGNQYEVQFSETLPWHESSGEFIPCDYLPDMDSQLYMQIPYANVYAFAIAPGQLIVLSPSGSKYITTGELQTYKVIFTDGKLSVE